MIFAALTRVVIAEQAGAQTELLSCDSKVVELGVRVDVELVLSGFVEFHLILRQINYN